MRDALWIAGHGCRLVASCEAQAAGGSILRLWMRASLPAHVRCTANMSKEGVSVLCRAWLSARGILQGSGSGSEHIATVDEGLLASLLLALQQLPSLLTSAPRTESVNKVREGLSQVGLILPRHCLNSPQPLHSSIQ